MAMKKRQRKQLYIGLFIVFLMVTSTIGFIYSSDSGERYNGRGFTATENGWVTYVEETGQYWTFNYLPEEVDFDVNIGTISDKIYVVLEDNTHYSDLMRKFALLGVITERIDPEGVDCASGTSTLVFSFSQDNKIYKDGNCVYLEGHTPQLIDRLFYHALGVM